MQGATSRNRTEPQRLWQCKGRCSVCKQKVAGPRHVHACACGGKVRQW